MELHKQTSNITQPIFDLIFFFALYFKTVLIVQLCLKYYNIVVFLFYFYCKLRTVGV